MAQKISESLVLKDIISRIEIFDLLEEIPQTVIFTFPPQTIRLDLETRNPAQASLATSHLSSLPSEILTNIVAATPLLDRLALARTCKLMATIAQDNNLLVADIEDEQTQIFPTWTYTATTIAKADKAIKNPVQLVYEFHYCESCREGHIDESYGFGKGEATDLTRASLGRELASAGVTASKGVVTAVFYEILAAALHLVCEPTEYLDMKQEGVVRVVAKEGLAWFDRKVDVVEESTVD